MQSASHQTIERFDPVVLQLARHCFLYQFERKRRHFVLQHRELIGHLDRKAIAAHGEKLSQFDKCRSQLNECLPQAASVSLALFLLAFAFLFENFIGTELETKRMSVLAILRKRLSVRMLRALTARSARSGL